MESQGRNSRQLIEKSYRKCPAYPQVRAMGAGNPRSSPSQGRGTDNKKSQVRTFSDMDVRAMEGEGNERKFILSFSSEEPYERFWGREILDHSPDAVDLTITGTMYWGKSTRYGWRANGAWQRSSSTRMRRPR